MTSWIRRVHWRECAIEGWALGCFMLSACIFGTLLFHPASPLASGIGSPWMRRASMGALMGLTLVALVYSPWGRRSGAHMNPAFTLTFFRLGKIAPADAAGYIVAQFVGGALGVWLAAHIVGMPLAHPNVNFVVTQPGGTGALVAFAGEFGISFLQMMLVLTVAGSQRWSRFTGVCAALAVALFITVEAPYSGMSMNPARSVASAVIAGEWQAIWLYFAAPLLAMSLASWVYVQRRSAAEAPCGKMMHASPCLFCDYVDRNAGIGNPSA
jgi:aquaporin Z